MAFLQHLVGRTMPDAPLEATSGSPVSLARIPGTAVIFCYPYTGRPGYPDPPNWDHIPNAHGSTPQALAYAASYGQFRRLGVKLFGLSLLDTEWQREFVSRHRLTFRLLSDPARIVQSALSLPLFETGGVAYMQRITFVLRDGAITAVRFPIAEPEYDAADVLEGLA